MANSVEFKTAKGNTVSVAIVRERSNIADANFTTRCLEVEVRVNGRMMTWGGTKLVDDAQLGMALRGYAGTDIIPVPAAHVDAIRDLLNAFAAEHEEKMAAVRAADAAYVRHYAGVNNLLDAGKC